MATLAVGWKRKSAGSGNIPPTLPNAPKIQILNVGMSPGTEIIKCKLSMIYLHLKLTDS